MGEVEELQAHVRKFEVHLNDLELELHATAHERDEVRQRAERWRQLAVRLVVNYDHMNREIANKSSLIDTAIHAMDRAWDDATAALAADPPAEAGGEVGSNG